MDVHAAIHPRTSPHRVVDVYAVRSPIKAADAPAPRPEEYADGYAEAETDTAADKEARARSKENNCRIVVGHHHKTGINRQNGDVRSAADDHLLVAAQVAVLLSLVALALHRVHDVLLRRQKRITEIRGPIHIVRHGVQHGREG